MELDAWPFFISSHRVQGFTVVVAPDFMCADDSAKLLATYAGGKPGDIKHYEIPRIKGVTKETLTLTYRVVLAEGSLVGDSTPVLKDAGGRTIPIIEGVVTKGKDRNLALTEDVFKLIREACLENFKTLWASPGVLPTQPSSCIIINIPDNFFLDENDSRLILGVFKRDFLQKNIVIILTVALFIIIIIILLVLLR